MQFLAWIHRIAPFKCFYCGRQAKQIVRGLAVCRSCGDLPQLDPHYAQVDQWVEAR